MKRVAVLGLVAWLAAAAAPASADRALRAGAVAAGAHGFYDHEGLFPVPISNFSTPYAEASFEPGPTSAALASSVWNPELAQLKQILCLLSNDGFCDAPEYPVKARASYPSSGDASTPPGFSFSDPDAPATVRAAHQEATAGPAGATGDAAVSRLGAVRMTGDVRGAVRSLESALGSAGSDADAGPWLIAVGQSWARSTSGGDATSVSGEAASRTEGVQLLGGLITMGEVRGEASVTAGDRTAGHAHAHVGRVRVGGLDASLTGTGIRVVDDGISSAERAAVQGALEGALSEAGFRVLAGDRTVTRTEGGVIAEATVASIEFRRGLVPQQFPEGTQGPDHLLVPLGFAHAEAGTVDLAGQASGGPGAAGASAASGAPATTAPGTDQPAQAVPATAPTGGIIDLGIPRWAVVLIVIGVPLAVAGLVRLRVQEVIRE